LVAKYETPNIKYLARIMQVIKKLEVLIEFIFNKRFRMDKKALESSKPLFLNLAWKLLDKYGVIETLKKGSTIEAIMEKHQLKCKKMLECMLDNLVGDGALEYKFGKYYFIRPPAEYKETHKKFLEKYYPKSLEWVEFMYTRSVETLKSGRPYEDTGFDSENLDLWDAIMLDAPYSFRGFTIKKLLKKVKPNADILDFGCGGGIGLQQFIELSKKPINLYGSDISKYILRAKTRIKKINKKNKNIRIVKIFNKSIDDLIKSEQRFDAIFMSLVLNHIKEEHRSEFLIKIRELLNPNGYVGIYQIINQSKFLRSPIWVMHAVPTHFEYPFRRKYLERLNKIFSRVEVYLNGNSIIAQV
jgi:2-polyprenyl-3-methyl-5-hydroxy-6-metoxy-1,4-benzoquinol methylase